MERVYSYNSELIWGRPLEPARGVLILGYFAHFGVSLATQHELMPTLNSSSMPIWLIR